MARRALFVSPVERLVYLRTVPLFARLNAGQLAALAEHAHEYHFSAGTRLVRRGEPVDEVHIVVQGQVRVSRGRESIRILSSRDSIGLLSLLATRRMHTSQQVEAIAMTRGMSLALPADALFDLFEDRFSIYQHVLIALCRLMRSERAKLRELLERDGGGLAPPLPRQPDLVDRMIILGGVLDFADASSVALSQLARRAQRVSFASGEPLWRRGDTAAELVVPLSGSLKCVALRASHFVIPAGVLCGFIDSMSASTRSYSAAAAESVEALRIDRDIVLDALEDHPDAAFGCLASLARDLLRVLARRAADTEQIPVGMEWEEISGGVRRTWG